MKSMTGYGRAEAENDRYRVEVSVRTVNHRNLDLAIRLPERQRGLERSIRDALSASLLRGRVDVRVGVDSIQSKPVEVKLRRDVVRELAKAVRELNEEGEISGQLRPGDLLRMPEALEIRVRETDWSDEDEALLDGTVRQAVLQVVQAREQEGANLAAVLEKRLSKLEEIVEKVSGQRGEVRDRIAIRLRSRLSELLDDREIPEERVAQELALLAEKSDIQEELDRLRSHLELFRQVVVGGDGPAGKRLDFLSQEVLRELNTLAAKGRDSGILHQVLDAKLLCEQMREQVQNVE